MYFPSEYTINLYLARTSEKCLTSLTFLFVPKPHINTFYFQGRVMVFNTTFNNISVIL